jgi:hypothetical protein
MISTEVSRYPDGAVVREQIITARTPSEVVATYRMLAEIDAKVAAGEALDRIVSESRA